MPRQRSPIPWLKVRDGVFYVWWYADGRTHRMSLGVPEAEVMEAQKAYALFLSEGHAVRGSNGALGLTATHALDDYLREHVREKVVDQRRQEHAITHLKAFFGNTLLKSIDIPMSRAYVAARRAGIVSARAGRGGSADGTLRRELGVLQAAARHALRWKRIAVGEMPSLELPAGSTSEAKWLTEAELARALTTASGHLKDFMTLAYYTAARRTSIERLRHSQVNLKTGSINLSSPTETANQRRSKKRRPVVPIDPKMRPTVERLMMVNRDSEWLFGQPREMYRVMVRHMSAIGLGDRANPHVLRHSRATHLLMEGVNLWDVAKLLGDTVATVERVYGHACVEHMAKAIKGRE